MHFPTLSSVEEKSYTEYVFVIIAIKEEFLKRFRDVSQASEWFWGPFAVSVDDIHPDLQMELIDLLRNSRLKHKFLLARRLTEFYQDFPQQEFPRIHCEAAKIMS